MKITATPIQGVYLVETTPFRDERGIFYRAFCDRELGFLLQGETIRQVNVSQTEAVGTIRGLHFQYPPHAEIKLIRCLRGRVWDVIVDLRRDSPTFLKWYQVDLSDDNAYMIVVPKGCAHGFQTLELSSELLYLHTACYANKYEGGIHYKEPKLSIPWPLEVTHISPRDASHPFLSEDFQGIAL